jgi:bifunctional non-homologous end joining protein LigD
MGKKLQIPDSEGELYLDRRAVKLTNQEKLFWPKLGITKRDLLQYYLDIADVLLPHLQDRAMVMKRYPNGAEGEFFFMKRAPKPRPAWVRTCSIKHGSGNVIDFPVAQDRPTLLWLINLGCIDLNPWYARCDDVQRPDYLHFDLDPVPKASFDTVREVALIIEDALRGMKLPCYFKTSGSKGIHVYIPIERGPTQKQVWEFAKFFAKTLEKRHPKIVTAEYRVAKRPKNRVLVDYNQNAWGRTLASVYSVRPKPNATVSMPVTSREIKNGVTIEDFTIQNSVKRILKKDLWKGLLEPNGRADFRRVYAIYKEVASAAA